MPRKRSNGAPVAEGAERKTHAPTREGAYFLSVTLRNIRCFGDLPQTLDFSDGKGRPARWTVLLGDNGTGKTTVLQALVALQDLPVVGLFDDRVTGWNPRCLAWGPQNWEKGFFRSWPDHTLSLDATVAYGPGLALSPSEYRKESFHIATAAQNPGQPEVSTSSSTYPPLCFAYGPIRRMGAPALREPEEDDATATLFLDGAELRNAEQWLMILDYSAKTESPIQESQRGRLDRVKHLLLKVLPSDEVEDIRFSAPTVEQPTPRVEFRTRYGWVPFRRLGHGYRTLIAWVLDFTSRMEERYPDSPDPLAEPAVVLVDEIDLHLHPTWQRQLIGYLTERFPNTQFIATAHSPLIVQAAGDANLVLLRREGDHVVIDNDPATLRGWSVDQLLTSELYGLPSPYPPQYDDLIRRRDALLSKPKLTKADEKELERLNKEMDELPIGDTMAQAKAMMLLKKTTSLLQRRMEQDS